MATIVLVHGTTAGGWVWKPIVPMLEAAGHVVYRPTLTGLGERVHLLTREVGLDTHITDIVNVLEYEDLNEVVLVGHSYGGMVITGVAERVPHRLRELVYFDAVIPEDGESATSSMNPEVLAETMLGVNRDGEGWTIPVARGPNDVGTRNTPHPLKSWTDPIQLSNPARSQVPATYVRFSADKLPGSRWEKTMSTSWGRAQARGWRVRELDTVHQIMADPMPKGQILLELYPAGS